MNDPRTYEIEIGGKTLTIQHGILAQQANGAVTVRLGDTVVLVTVCMAEAREGIDFFPLTVDYEERLYAVGKIPGGFPRREGRASTEAILAMRLTDRPLRPLFPKGFRNEVQVIATTLSADREHQPDTLITIGASAALGISDIPFNGPVSSVRVTRLDGQYIVNPTFDETERGDLDIVVAGTKDAVVMVEAGAKQVSEDVVLEAIEVAMEANRKIIALQEQIAADVAPVKKPFTPAKENEEAIAVISEYLKDRIPELVATAASERSDANKAVRQELQERFGDRFTSADIADALWNIIKKAMRKQILEQGIRADGRGIKDIRPLDIHVGVLPRTHGSGLFQRGQTQVLTIATLGGLSMVQKLDTLSPDEYKRYMHHYNFPPYSVGEVRPLRGAGRREIGHGALAERALEPVIPSEEEFPYALRLVSEVMSSNGSTSMASVCGSTLALMDAGVPISAPVAGIAMGLIMGEDGNYRVLTDIAGQEDFMGDMDFKVAGTAKGITALQMDIKISGVSRELLATALEQAREARQYILERMLEVIPEPRPELSPYAPKMYKVTIPQDMIGTLIGPGGKTVRRIQDESGGATIDIQEDGTVIVGSPNEEVARKAIRMIEGLTKEVQVGEIYTGKVTRLLNFGAFVEILPGKEGLIHISQLGADHVRSVEDEVKVGDEVTVMVSEIDNLGRINLSRRAVLLGETPEQAAAASRDGGRDRDRGPRGGGPGGPGGGSRPSDRDRGGRGGGPQPQRASQPQPSRPAPASTGPVGGATRGWVRRTPPAEGAPPPPRRDFGGGMNED
ncbi:polyribonucleotide nucleotidyltransferase [Tepidiforma thermophila]|uniref:Polyribonucleotide nucleotidyltransferase n=1 Tax=Tepidiforma thermophila (strain KCTC 52669 / CGMCC 1.13589 / G233) TaxID=2761530 RepID=A0A2A9HCM0_TEPT2|nr:polyribonucleotide nucleotidyltransferase [Tepidiforma thermophila]PFG72902.1 polyribonucleotide nucleotidyltransferase [Tepidiforma thermophila]